jgi:hypothetical protein
MIGILGEYMHRVYGSISSLRIEREKMKIK